MNNNRNQNNRRRGRGNRNQGGGGQGNRIDSRARGNAPQLLEKYRKLAEDAHRNGDRVQAEYYLQFADHYFRVIADNRSRQDEQRGEFRQDQRFARREERDGEEFDGEFEGGEFGEAGDERRRFEPRESREPREGREREGREARRERPRRDRPRDDMGGDEPAESSEGPAFEPADNPFTRDNRDEAPRRRAPRPRRDGVGNGSAAYEAQDDAGFDPAVLPPSFSAADTVSPPAADDAGQGDEPAPRRRRTKRSDGGTLSAVG